MAEVYTANHYHLMTNGIGIKTTLEAPIYRILFLMNVESPNSNGNSNERSKLED